MQHLADTSFVHAQNLTRCFCMRKQTSHVCFISKCYWLFLRAIGSTKIALQVMRQHLADDRETTNLLSGPCSAKHPEEYNQLADHSRYTKKNLLMSLFGKCSLSVLLPRSSKFVAWDVCSHFKILGLYRLPNCLCVLHIM